MINVAAHSLQSEQKINGTLMIPADELDVINNFRFDIFGSDPWVLLLYSYILNSAEEFWKIHMVQ